MNKPAGRVYKMVVQVANEYLPRGDTPGNFTPYGAFLAAADNAWWLNAEASRSGVGDDELYLGAITQVDKLIEMFQRLKALMSQEVRDAREKDFGANI